jgi:hypothetical protein
MDYALRAILIVALVALMAFLLAHVGQVPVPVTLQWGTLSLSTTAPVAATIILFLVLVIFYIGQFSLWLFNLPASIAEAFSHRKRRSSMESLTQAFSALAAGDAASARKFSQNIKLEEASGPAANLATLLALHLNQLGSLEAEKHLNNPTIGPAIALHLTRQAAAAGNWAEVLRLSETGLRLLPKHPAFTVLHFKALVNLGNPAAAKAVGSVKHLLTRNQVTLLTALLDGPTALNARPVLDNPWVRALQAWFPTASETFPVER